MVKKAGERTMICNARIKGFMIKKFLIIMAMLCVASGAMGYNSEHGPFADNVKFKQITLTPLSREPKVENISETCSNFVFAVGGVDARSVFVNQRDNSFLVSVTVAGRQVLPPSEFSDFGFFELGLEAFSDDLNQDGVVDFIVYSSSGGCGLAGGYCNIAFILSANDKYTITTVTTLFPDKSDFVIINKKPCFIHTAFAYVDQCNDGKNHNFWIYQLLAFGKDGVTIDNSIHDGFPKTVYYTFKPNHAETTIITTEQKATLWKQATSEVYWKKDYEQQSDR